MNKRGDIWISAVIYIALGIIAISLILGAGLPLINNVRDRNTFQQTKEIMNAIDSAITSVVAEGPGSRRYLSPITIKKGELFFKKDATNEIVWLMETNSILQEPGSTISEGSLKVGFQEHELIVNLYVASLTYDYYNARKINLVVSEEDRQPLNGKYSISITNTGYEPGSDFVDVEILVE